MSNNPKVSVLMPVYNGEKYIKEAIDSILAQTFTDFELIVINDGSTDKTIDIINSYCDKRINLIINKNNQGPARARNLGIKNSKGEYIAFLDSDDYAYPNRLQKQVDFLDKNPDFGLIGSAVKNMDETSKITSNKPWEFPAQPEQIPAIMLFNNYFALSAVMTRKTALHKELFRTNYTPSEDYDLWIRIKDNWKLWNLPNVLLRYRENTKGISKTQSDKYARVMPQIYADQFKKLGLNPSNKDLELYYSYCYGQPKISLDFIVKMNSLLLEIYQANKISKIYDEAYLLKEVVTRWYRLCHYNTGNKLTGLKLFLSSNLIIECFKNFSTTLRLSSIIINRILK